MRILILPTMSALSRAPVRALPGATVEVQRDHRTRPVGWAPAFSFDNAS